jgi:hypothetical protein
MQRDRKLSSDNEFDIKYIVTFTIAFVVISCIILAAGYMLLTMTGILGHAEVSPTPTPSPTAKPTYVIIGVPTETPCPTPVPTPRPPTPTPSPTPVPSPYDIKIALSQANVGSMKYNVTFSLLPDSESLDMTQTRLKISDWETTYCDYAYNEMMYWLDGYWYNSDGDDRLDPTGESITFMISAYGLNIPLERETRLSLSLDGTELRGLPLPSFQNSVDFGESPDPNSTSEYNPGYNYGNDGTSDHPWVTI